MAELGLDPSSNSKTWAFKRDERASGVRFPPRHSWLGVARKGYRRASKPSQASTFVQDREGGQQGP